jgi:hypothetical protein
MAGSLENELKRMWKEAVVLQCEVLSSTWLQRPTVFTYTLLPWRERETADSFKMLTTLHHTTWHHCDLHIHYSRNTKCHTKIQDIGYGAKQHVYGNRQSTVLHVQMQPSSDMVSCSITCMRHLNMSDKSALMILLLSVLASVRYWIWSNLQCGLQLTMVSAVLESASAHGCPTRQSVLNMCHQELG